MCSGRGTWPRLAPLDPTAMVHFSANLHLLLCIGTATVSSWHVVEMTGRLPTALAHALLHIC